MQGSGVHVHSFYQMVSNYINLTSIFHAQSSSSTYSVLFL